MASTKKPQVNQKKCLACGACICTCPNKAIDWKNGKAWIDWKKCKLALKCIPVCPVKAISR
jgi:Pyruvate/2-oxoacid:ferredoxin oxidoreductase delta subunit